MKSISTRLTLLAALVTAALPAQANEAAIRKSLTTLQPQLPKIDEVRPGPMPGLWEVRFGNQIKYTDATGTLFFDGEIHDLKNQRNLTEERVVAASRIDFSTLPLKDALMWKNGSGKRKLVVFADPNCGVCRRFEQALQEMKDITVYTFVIPILGGDSPEKSRAIVCAKDPTATYLAWMLRAESLPKSTANCDAGLIERNLALANKVWVSGTPAIVLPDGNRIPGAVGAVELERRLQQAMGGKS
ncbi:DsbC family protein [Roseateles sp.]|uniref:DsbC family protein n=1 Tax=Roseateles sp. TaxID=1971397 RepID=UPI00394ACA06